MALLFLSLIWGHFVLLMYSQRKRPQYSRVGRISLAVVFALPIPIVSTAVYLTLWLAQ